MGRNTAGNPEGLAALVKDGADHVNHGESATGSLKMGLMTKLIISSFDVLGAGEEGR